MPQRPPDVDVDPAYLRLRAQIYRDLASEETDPDKALLYREIAAALDSEADSREHAARA